MAATVGLIIPTYNRAEMLGQAIESVLAQSRVPDEIIVVDDGSTDGTWELLQGYPPPVYAFRQRNRGRSNARNEGIERCGADFVCFLDSDDLLVPGSVEARVRWLEANPDHGVVYGQVAYADAAGRPIPGELATGPCLRGNIFPALAKYNTIPILAIMIRRDCLPEPPYFDEKLEKWEDWDFLLRVASRCKFGCLDEIVGLYRQHSGMTIGRGAAVEESTMTVQERIYRVDAFLSLPAASRARIYGSHALGRLRAGHVRRARECLLRGMREVPWYLPLYVIWALSLIGPGAADAVVKLWRMAGWAGRSR